VSKDKLSKDKKNDNTDKKVKSHKSECNCDDNAPNKCDCGDDCDCKTESKEKEYLELAQRIQAEFENYKKRNLEIVATSYHNGISAVVNKLLPSLDSFQQAKGNITDVQMLSGLDLIYSQIMSALASFGVTRIDCLGKIFDPNFHNAVLVEKNEKYEDEVILEEYQAGFMMNNKVIRPSSVKINKL